jgi:23S rRNA pseudouridine2605 synthase
MATERLQKILARAGVASRRAAEAMIADGRVRVNGRVVSELGTKADPRKDRVEVDGRRLVAEAPVYLAVHKPRGVVSTMSDPEGRPSMKELLANVPARVFPVGRLDFATSGIILATNDGTFSDGLLHPRRAVPKTYVLKVKGVMKPEDIERWRRGVRLEDGMTLPAEAKFIRHEEDKTWIELTITEGRNQQIRRMGDATGFRVMRLARVAFAGVSSEGLRPGDWRFLTREELVALKQAYGVPERIAAPPAPATANTMSRRVRSSPTASAPRPRDRGHRRGAPSRS